MKPIELFIHFDEADPAKIVFFGNYYRLAHRAMELSLPQWGLTWDDFFRREKEGFPVRHTEAEYLKPTRPGALVYVTVYPEKLGDSSMTFRSEFRDQADSSVAPSAVVKVVHVCVDAKARKKTSLPEDLKTALTPYVSKPDFSS